MAGQEAAMGALGALIFAGIFGRLFLRKTGFSDVFLLLVIGAGAGALLPASALSDFSGVMLLLGAVALLMIIMEEGLHLSIASIVRHAHKSMLLGAASFFLSFVAVFFLTYFFVGYPPAICMILGALFASVAPELLSGFLSSMGSSETMQSIGKLESVFSEALSVIFTLVALAAAIGAPAAFSNPAYDLSFLFLLSAAMGGVFAAFWKGLVRLLDEENEHISVIGLGALLYAIAGLMHANGVIAVFFYALFIGNSKHESIVEVKRFQSEISFFLRTFFFVYLGALLFHSEKSIEVALLSLAIAALLAAARMLAGRSLVFLEPSVRAERILEVVSSRGLTAAVLSIVVSEELHAAGVATPVDIPLLALFVIFFSNLLSALLVLRHGRKGVRAQKGGPESGPNAESGLYGT